MPSHHRLTSLTTIDERANRNTEHSRSSVRSYFNNPMGRLSDRKRQCAVPTSKHARTNTLGGAESTKSQTTSNVNGFMFVYGGAVLLRTNLTLLPCPQNTTDHQYPTPTSKNAYQVNSYTPDTYGVYNNPADPMIPYMHLL